MTFVHPGALCWALLAVPLVILYLRRVRPRRRAVGTGFLWRRVFSDTPAGGAWRRWRRPASLGIHLAVLMLIVLAMAEPLDRPSRQIVLVIDNSASMGATDAAPTRLDQARRLARQRIRRLGYRDQVAVITAGGRVDVLCKLTGRKDALQRALEEVRHAAGPNRVAEAVALGRRLVAESPRGEILVVSDGCFAGSVGLAAAADVRLIRVPAVSASHEERPGTLGPGPPLWTYLAAVALLVVVVEWCLCQRRWTC